MSALLTWSNGRMAALLENGLRRRETEPFLVRAAEGLRAGETLLDLGAGSGLVSRTVASRVPGLKVVALDLSTQLLERLERSAAAEGLAARVTTKLADAAASGLPASSVERVVSNGLLHELLDPEAALAEALRVLKPGGALLVRDFCKGRRDLVLKLLHRRGAHGPFSTAELESSLRRLGFCEVTVVREGSRLIAAALKPTVNG